MKVGIIIACLLIGAVSTLAQLPPVEVPPPPIEFAPWQEVSEPEGGLEFEASFPSALLSGVPENDRVALRVILPDDRAAAVPVVLILHYWGATDLRAERSLAAELNRRGVAAAIMTLPFHLERTPAGRRSGEMAVQPDPEKLKLLMTQACFDVRRSVDFLATRPELRRDQVGLMGTSLGALVAALGYAVDPRFSRVAFVVGGVDIANILWESSRVVPQREALRRKGFTEAKLRLELAEVEPMNRLPRSEPGKAFVVAGRYDTVVPRASTQDLIDRLDSPQVLWLDTGHYGGIFIQRRLLREVAAFFDAEFHDRAYLAPKRLVAPTIRVGAKLDVGLGPDLGVGLDLIRFDDRGDAFLNALITPRGAQLVLARRVWQGLAIGVSGSTRGLGVGLFWSTVL